MWSIRKKLKAYRSMHMFSSPKADHWHQFHERLCDVGMLTASKKDQELFCKAQIITNKLIPHQVIVKKQTKKTRIEMSFLGVCWKWAAIPQRPRPILRCDRLAPWHQGLHTDLFRYVAGGHHRHT